MGVKAGIFRRAALSAPLLLAALPNTARADSRIPWWEFQDIVRNYDCQRVATE
jgi:hypothetical protein